MPVLGELRELNPQALQIRVRTRAVRTIFDALRLIAY